MRFFGTLLERGKYCGFGAVSPVGSARLRRSGLEMQMSHVACNHRIQRSSEGMLAGTSVGDAHPSEAPTGREEDFDHARNPFKRASYLKV